MLHFTTYNILEYSLKKIMWLPQDQFHHDFFKELYCFTFTLILQLILTQLTIIPYMLLVNLHFTWTKSLKNNIRLLVALI